MAFRGMNEAFAGLTTWASIAAVLTLMLGAQTMVLAQDRQYSAQKADEETTRTSKEKPTERMEEIVVTGTKIRGVTPDKSPSPIFIFEREDIDKSGYRTLHEFFASVPQNFGGGANIQTRGGAGGADPTANSNLADASSVNLRGLGGGATLTLINGRRVAASGNLGNFTDIGTIPLSAIERIEILADGASAIYGTDAVAGVVNIILRKDFIGSETELGYGSVTNGAMNEWRINHTAGTKWNGGSGLITYDFYDKGNLDARDRNFAYSALVAAGLLPNDLLPKERRHTFFATGSHEMSNQSRVSLDLMYGKRNSTRVFTDSATSSGTSLTEAERYGAASALTYRLPRDWQVEIDGVYNRNGEFTNNIRTIGTDTHYRGKTDLITAGVKADGPLLNVPAGLVRLAMGSEFRYESVYADTSGLPIFDGKRNILAMFGETLIPLRGAANWLPGMEALDLTAAGRYERYDDFGSTTNPKVGLRWVPVSGYTLRSTYSTSFRAPPLPNIAPAAHGVTIARLPDPNSPTGRTLTILPFSNTNPDLKPERAKSWTFGADVRPKLVPGLGLKVDYYDINFTDRIGFPIPNSQLFTALANEAAYGSFIIRNPSVAFVQALLDAAATMPNGIADGSGIPGGARATDIQAFMSRVRSNTGGLHVRGIDFDFAYSFDNASGNWNWSLNGNYVFDYKVRGTPNGPPIQLVRTALNPVDLKLRGGISWTDYKFGVNTFVNYTNSYTNTFVAPNPKVGSWTTVDLSLTYDTGSRSPGTLLNDVRFTLSATNVFDRDPPFFDGGTAIIFQIFGYDTTNASPLGRFVSFTIRKRW